MDPASVIQPLQEKELRNYQHEKFLQKLSSVSWELKRVNDNPGAKDGFIPVLNPDFLDTLSLYSQVPVRSPRIGDRFIQSSRKNLDSKARELQTITQGLEKWLKWLRQNEEEIQTAQDILTRIEDQIPYSFPALPVDVARLIVEQAIVLDRKIWLDLSLVSKQVQQWSDRQYFDTLFFDNNKALKLTNETNIPTRFLEQLTGTTTIVSRAWYNESSHSFPERFTGFSTFLNRCSNIRNLYLSGLDDRDQLLEVLPQTLRKLSIPDPGDLLDAGFLHPSMKQITHLDIRCDRLLDESWTGFKELTSLKYFRMVDDYGGHEEIHSALTMVTMLPTILIWQQDSSTLWLSSRNAFTSDTLFGNDLEEGWLWKEGERIIRKRKAELAAGSWYGSLPGFIGGRMVPGHHCYRNYRTMKIVDRNSYT
ncbi:hypothetical protein DL96DRAFT_1553754 [Flagelloscypha sp. PMI_526]|nr:hypothetical protein DL96DRAFT_1553754 [Flagelloscypha sp. PMI_526]